MRSLFITAIYFSFFIYGFQAPFVFLLGYVWVDIFAPQLIAYTILPWIPVSMIIGVATISSALFIKRDSHERLPVISWMLLIFSLWMTITLAWSEVPDAALEKWDSAFKNVLIASLVPLIIRGRIELEAMIWTIVISGIAHCIPFGIKVLLSGGGYGINLGLIQSNSGYGEGSTLAMFSVSIIPLCIFLFKHGQILPINRFVKIILICFILAAILTSLGTYARTGLVSVAALVLGLFLLSKKKMMYIFALPVLIAAGVIFMGDSWQSRMSTITSSNESSGMGRVAVWMWTLEYIASHPWGGGLGFIE